MSAKRVVVGRASASVERLACTGPAPKAGGGDDAPQGGPNLADHLYAAGEAVRRCHDIAGSILDRLQPGPELARVDQMGVEGGLVGDADAHAGRAAELADKLARIAALLGVPT